MSITTRTMPPASGAAGIARRGGTSRWGVLALLSAGTLIAFIDRTSMSAAIATPFFKTSFHLTNLERGWLNSAFFWSYAVFQMPMGWIVDRAGVKWPYAVSFLIWCVASAMTGLMTAFAGLVLMRLILGAAEAAVVPATYRWIRDNYAEGESGTAVGLYMLGAKAGTALGAPVAAWLIVNYDWRVMFVVTGIMGAVWLLPWMLFARDHTRDTVAGPAPEMRRVHASALPLRRIMRSPMIWGTLINAFCYNYFTFYAMTWMPAYLAEQRHLSLERSGVYTGFSFAGLGIVSLLAGLAADRLIARGANAVVVRKAFVIAGFAGACTVVLGATAPSLGMALFWNVFSLSFVGLSTANNLSLCRLTLVPAPAVGLVTGVQQVATSLAGIAAPIMTGWLLGTTGSFAAPMRVLFVVMLIATLTTALLLRPRYAPTLPALAPG